MRHTERAGHPGHGWRHGLATLAFAVGVGAAAPASAAYWAATLIGGATGSDVVHLAGVDAAGRVVVTTYQSGVGNNRAFLFDGSSATALGTLGGDFSIGTAARGGYSAGYADTAAAGPHHAYVSNGSSMTDLGTLGGGDSLALAVNRSGQATGSSETANGQVHAYRYSGGTMTGLGTLGGFYSEGLAINESGHVAGVSQTATGRWHAFLATGATMQDLGTLGGDFSRATAINDAGQVAGTAWLADGRAHAFRYENGTMADLGTLGGFHSDAAAINSAGEVVGGAMRSDGVMHAFRYTNGTMTDLGTLSADAESGAFAINDLGLVLGLSHDLVSGDRDWFVHDGASMTSVVSLAAAIGIVEVYAAVLGEAGHIAGVGVDAAGVNRTFLLTLEDAQATVPEPSSLALLLAGLALALPRRLTSRPAPRRAGVRARTAA